MNTKIILLLATPRFRLLSRLILPLFVVFFVGFACQSGNDQAFLELSEEERHRPENSLLGIELRDGLEAQLFASEEMVVNPTNMDIDERGRVWITEGVNYRPDLNPQMPVKEEGDRIVILEDTNGDGKADSEKVFYQGREIDSALGIMVLGNQVIVSRSPHVFIFTDTTGNDQADTKEILFSGIGGEQHDHGVHAFVMGPDGKFYFNAGDQGQYIHDAEGELIVDQAGNRVITDGNPYRKGMIFRVNRDGSEFEVLAHNFR
ncbi:MAG: PVC-type heme-binding CxxCH protein, partial [Balneolaceae bacterium]